MEKPASPQIENHFWYRFSFRVQVSLNFVIQKGLLSSFKVILPETAEYCMAVRIRTRKEYV